MTEKLYQDKDWLYEQYWVQEKGTTEIAEMVGCVRGTIHRWMKRLGISRRTPVEAARLRSRNPRWRRNQIKAGRCRSQDPEWQRRQAEKNRRLAQDPEWHKSVTRANRHRARDPIWRKKLSDACRRLAQDPEWQRKNTETSRRLAQDPEWQRKYAEGRQRMGKRLALKKRNQGEMTDIEAICHVAFDSLNLDFVFEKFIYPYRVDFFFPSHGIIVEAQGKYWHSKPKRRKRDAERKQYLEASGYTVLEWWGPNIKADIYQLIDDELLPLLNQPSRMERPPRGVSRPHRGPHGWKSAIQLSLFGKEPDD